MGLTDPSEEEAELKRVMLAHSNKNIVLLDSYKMNENGFARICDFSVIDYIITETELSPLWVNHLKENNVNILYSD